MEERERERKRVEEREREREKTAHTKSFKGACKDSLGENFWKTNFLTIGEHASFVSHHFEYEEILGRKRQA